MNQSDIELAKEIKRLIAKSSPLPWAAVGWNNDRRRNLEIKAKDNTAIATIWRVSCTCIDGHQYKNDKLILHGVNALPRLCKAILQAGEEIAALTDSLPEDDPNYDSCGCRYEGMGYGAHIPKRIQVCFAHKLLEEEIKLYEQLYDAVNEMLARLGCDGFISTRASQVNAVMNALFNIDGGEYKPKTKSK